MSIAALTVAARSFEIPIRGIVCDTRRPYAAVDAEWLSLRFPVHDQSLDAREALEHDCIAIYAGIVARAIALGRSHTTYGWHDQELVCDLLDRIEYDECLKTSWHDYQRERARLFVTQPATWTQIEVLAALFREEPVMDGARVEAVLASPRCDRVIVPAQIPWQAPPPAEPSNVVLVWQKPGLTEIVTHALTRLGTGDGDEP